MRMRVPDNLVEKNPLITARDIGKRFGKRWVLVDIDLEIGPGCIYGLLGRNGAGKTTLLRILLGLIKPDTGNSSVLGMDSIQNGTAVRQACGSVLGPGAIYGELSVWDNVEFAARAWSMAKSHRKTAIEEALDWGGIAERRFDKAKSLSQGMRQRLALATAIVHQPKVLVLDEPTTGLDVPAANAFRDYVRRWSNQSGAAVILSTHDLYEIDRLCDRIGLLEQQTLSEVEHVSSERTTSAWTLRLELNQNLSSQLDNLKGLANVVVGDKTVEMACSCLGEAKENKAKFTALGFDNAHIVLAHNGDLAEIFNTDRNDEEGLGCVR